MSDLNPYEEGLALELTRAQARIKELEARLAGAVAECERIGRLWHDAEAKLAKAVEALEWQASQQEAPPFMAANARAILA